MRTGVDVNGRAMEWWVASFQATSRKRRIASQMNGGIVRIEPNRLVTLRGPG